MWWFIDVKFSGNAAKQIVQLSKDKYTTINKLLGEPPSKLSAVS